MYLATSLKMQKTSRYSKKHFVIICVLIQFMVTAHICLFSSSTQAQENRAEKTKKRIAVLEFTNLNNDFDQNVVKQLSDEARRAVIDVLPKTEFSLMTRENQETILQAMDVDLKNCDVASVCEVELLKIVTADYGITGNVSKIAGTSVVTLKIFDVTSGELIGSNRVQAENDLTLLDIVYETSKSLLQQSVLPKESSIKPKIEQNNAAWVPWVWIASGVTLGVGVYVADRVLPTAYNDTLELLDIVPIVLYGASLTSIGIGVVSFTENHSQE